MKRVAVIGAGSMGLAAAYQLILDGHEVVVFEADDRIGGMAASFDLDGTLIERYYHFHCTSDDAVFELLSELSLADAMRWSETKMGYWYQRRLQEWGNPLALLRFKGLGVVAKVRYGLHAAASVRRRNWRPLDRVEATGWVRRWVGEEAYETLWKTLFDLKFYEFSTNLSAAWIWTRIRRVGRSRYDVMREKLGYIEGGSYTLLSAVAAFIESRGGEIRLGAPVGRIVVEGDAVRGVESRGLFEAFDAVVSTVPLPYVPDMLPDLPEITLEPYRRLHNIGVVCVIVKLRRRVTRFFWLNTHDRDMDIPGLVEYTNLRPLDAHVVYVPYYLPSDNPRWSDPDETFAGKVRSYLTEINPELDEDDFIAFAVHRYLHAQPICTPGYLDTLPPSRTAVSGLWVADTSHYYPEDRGMSESIGLGRRLACEVPR